MSEKYVLQPKHFCPKKMENTRLYKNDNMGCNSSFFSKIKFHLRGWDPRDLVERPKLILGTGVEIAVGVLKACFVEKSVFG